MANKVKRVLNLSADKVNSYVFKDSPSIYWSWWHVIATVAFVVFLVLALSLPFKAHASPIFEPNTHLQCRIEVTDVMNTKRYVTFKAFGSHQIESLEGGVIQLKGDTDFPRSVVNSITGEFFAVAGNWKYSGVCRNEPNIKVLP